MTQALLPVEQIRSNPYQTRLADDAAHVQAIADSIREVGLLQVPLARPAAGGAAELAFGHSRLAAWQIAKPGEPFPLEIRELSDRQMSDLAAEENSRRKNLSAIETARAIQRRIADFGLTQLEAGKPFGYSSQGAVANLLRLLQLPDDTQQLVGQGELPERAARALLPLMRYDPHQVSKIAHASAKGDPDERAARVASAIDDLVRKAPHLDGWHHREHGGWDLAWPGKPIAVPNFRKEKGEPGEVPACKGCEFAHTHGHGLYCLRPACYALKARLYAEHQAAAAAKRLGIPLAEPGDKVTVIYSGGYDYREQQRAEKLVRAARPELRLVPNPKPGQYDNALNQVLGTAHVVLAATSKAAVEKFLDESQGKSVSAPRPGETAAQKRARLAREEKAQDERRAERIQLNRSRADILWLLDHVAGLVADHTVAAGGLLSWAAHTADSRHTGGNYVSEVNAARDSLRQRGQLQKATGRLVDRWPGSLRHPGGDGAGPTPEVDHARRAFIAYSVMADELTGYKTPSQFYADVKAVREGAERIATRTFGIELPGGWDKPPIHHTNHNCWTCGRFAGNPGGLTKAEMAAGWVKHEQGKALLSVHCPEHAKDLQSLAAAGIRPKSPNGKANGKTPAAAVGVSTGKLSKRAKQKVKA